MRLLTRFRKGAGVAIALAVLLAPAIAMAETEVLESSAPGLAVGDKLADNARVKVPDGASIRVLIQSSGTTKTLKGPYEGTIGAYKDDRSWWERITGRKKDDDAPIGATRGMRLPQQ
jgi:hypothetical protein